MLFQYGVELFSKYFYALVVSSVTLCIKLFAAATRWLYQNLRRVYTEAKSGKENHIEKQAKQRRLRSR